MDKKVIDNILMILVTSIGAVMLALSIVNAYENYFASTSCLSIDSRLSRKDLIAFTQMNQSSCTNSLLMNAINRLTNNVMIGGRKVFVSVCVLTSFLSKIYLFG